MSNKCSVVQYSSVLQGCIFYPRFARAAPTSFKSLGMLPCFYIYKKGHLCPKTGHFLPCFEILLISIIFLSISLFIFSFIFLFSNNFVFRSLLLPFFCHSAAPPPLGGGVMGRIYTPGRCTGYSTNLNLNLNLHKD